MKKNIGAVTAIISFGVTDSNSYLVGRVIRLAQQCAAEGLAIILSSVGSTLDHINNIQSQSEAGWQVISNPYREFNLSAARNQALAKTKTEWALILDADLVLPEKFGPRLAQTIAADFMLHPNAFLTLPVAYLKESVSPSVATNFSCSSENTHYILASSVVLSRSEHFLKLGLYSTAYQGWGFEDHDFAMRLVAGSTLFEPVSSPATFDPRPLQNQTLYRGWRAVYALHGRLAQNQELILSHQWHPESSIFKNEKLFRKNRRKFLKATKAVVFSSSYIPYFEFGDQIYQQFNQKKTEKCLLLLLFYFNEWKYTSPLYFTLSSSIKRFLKL